MILKRETIYGVEKATRALADGCASSTRQEGVYYL